MSKKGKRGQAPQAVRFRNDKDTEKNRNYKSVTALYYRRTVSFIAADMNDYLKMTENERISRLQGTVKLPEAAFTDSATREDVENVLMILLQAFDKYCGGARVGMLNFPPMLWGFIEFMAEREKLCKQ